MQTIRQAFYTFTAEPVAEYHIHIRYGICHYHDYGDCDYLADEICRHRAGSEP